MYRESISKEELENLPLEAFKGKVFVIDSEEKYADAVQYLQNEPVIGFDTETKPAFKKGVINKVSLLQLATAEYAFLFRINKVAINDDLKSVLANPNILKIGVAIKDDIRQLKSIRNFEPAGFIELQDYVVDFGIQDKSLKKLAAIVLDIRVSKSQRVTNWENPILTEGQIKYAATDAWVPYEIFKKLETNF